MQSFRDNIGYLLGLIIFVLGIPTVMWLVSGRPFPYIPASIPLCILAAALAIIGLTLSIWSIVHMRKVGKGNPFDAYGHEVAPRTKELMTSGLSARELQQYTDYAIRMYNPVDYYAVIRYYGSYDKMLTAINSNTGSEYDVIADNRKETAGNTTPATWRNREGNRQILMVIAGVDQARHGIRSGCLCRRFRNRGCTRGRRQNGDCRRIPSANAPCLEDRHQLSAE